jgi:hypothetical protein
MSPVTRSIHDDGIYRGLPTYDSSIRGQTAIVAGANGISGQYMLRVLAKSPQRWTKIYALSRRPPSRIDAPQIERIALDFLTGVYKIRAVLTERHVKADYVFFFAYKESSRDDRKIWEG